MTTRRRFLKTAGVAAAGTTLAAPAVAQSKIKWRQFCEVMKTRKRTLVTAPVPAPILRLAALGDNGVDGAACCRLQFNC